MNGGRQDLVGRTVAVTGATSGIGEAVAEALLRRGAHVVAVGRDRTRISVTEAKWRAAGFLDRVTFLQADLSLLAEVRRVAGQIASASPRLDVLVNNAGGLFARRTLTAEGHEHTWALNVLAPQLLVELLYDRLAAGGSGRVVNVASAAHRWAHLDLNDLEGAGHYSGWGSYSRSKLALIMLTFETARRRPESKVTINAVHPGFVDSRFGHNNPGAFGVGIRLAESLFAISPQRGARTVVYCATAPELSGASGGYYARSRPREPSVASRDLEVAAYLWDSVHAALGARGAWAGADGVAG